jgi:hypothetical protein
MQTTLSTKFFQGPEISLDVEDDIDRIIENEKMIDWVIPHEFGHAIDWELENFQKLINRYSPNLENHKKIIQDSLKYKMQHSKINIKSLYEESYID